jgi:hypothetical protein
VRVTGKVRCRFSRCILSRPSTTPPPRPADALSMTALSAIALKQFATNTSKLAVLHTGLVLAWGVRIFAFLLYR